VLTTNDYAHLRNCALAGDVVTELPPFLAAPALQTGELVALLSGKPMPEQQLHLLYPSHRHPSAIVRTYLDFCQQQLSLLQLWVDQRTAAPAQLHPMTSSKAAP
jgi:DNA-binding transcriptional LysR family regulator